MPPDSVEIGFAFSSRQLDIALDAVDIDRSAPSIDLQIGRDGNTDSIINFPGKSQQGFGKFLNLLHEALVVCAGGKDANVIGFIIDHEIIYHGQTVEILFRVSSKLDLRSDIDFGVGPGFDRDRACRRTDERQGPAVWEPPAFVSHRGANKLRRLVHFGDFLLLCSVEVRSGK